MRKAATRIAKTAAAPPMIVDRLCHVKLPTMSCIAADIGQCWEMSPRLFRRTRSTLVDGGTCVLGVVISHSDKNSVKLREVEISRLGALEVLEGTGLKDVV
jgi:hypothetical protein